MKTLSFFFLIFGLVFGILFIAQLNAQVSTAAAEPVIQISNAEPNAHVAPQAFLQWLTAWVAALTSALGLLCAFATFVYGKYKELKAKWEEMEKRQDRQTAIVTETQKTIVDVAKSVPPQSTSTTVTTTATIALVIASLFLSGCVYQGEISYELKDGTRVGVISDGKNVKVTAFGKEK